MDMDCAQQLFAVGTICLSSDDGSAMSSLPLTSNHIRSSFLDCWMCLGSGMIQVSPVSLRLSIKVFLKHYKYCYII